MIRVSKRIGVNEITSIPELLIACNNDKNFLSNSLDYSMSKTQIVEVKLWILAKLICTHSTFFTD